MSKTFDPGHYAIWCIACADGVHTQCLGSKCQCEHLVRVPIDTDGMLVPSVKTLKLIDVLRGTADYFDEPGDPSAQSLRDLPKLLRAAAEHIEKGPK